MARKQELELIIAPDGRVEIRSAGEGGAALESDLRALAEALGLVDTGEVRAEARAKGAADGGLKGRA